MLCKIEAKDVCFVAVCLVREEALFQNDIYQVGDRLSIEVKANVTLERREIKTRSDAVGLFFSDDDNEISETIRTYLLDAKGLAPSIIAESVESTFDPELDVKLTRAVTGSKNSVTVHAIRIGDVADVEEV